MTQTWLTGKCGSIPEARMALIGGSSTNAIAFPEGVPSLEGSLLADGLVFDTPFGPSPAMKLLSLPGGERVLACRMHGWRPGVPRRAASQQLFWVLQEAGVERIIAEGGVGSINRDLEVGDVFIPDDYLDLSLRKDVSLTDQYLLIMRDPCCPNLRSLLQEAARECLGEDRTRAGGVYAVTDGRHFESRAEVRALARMGADAVGQSLAPEVYLAREIGACYAGIYQVVNRAEGVGEDWEHEELKSLFFQRADLMAGLLAQALGRLTEYGKCQCRDLRKATLIRADEYGPEE